MPLLTIAQACERLQVSRSRFNTWRKTRPEIADAERHLPGSRWVRFDADAIDNIGRQDVQS